MYLKITIIGFLLLIQNSSFSQDDSLEKLNFIPIAKSQIKRKIIEINEHFERSSNRKKLKALEFEYVPVYTVKEVECLNYTAAEEVDSASIYLSEVLILNKHFKIIGKWEKCKNGQGYISMIKHRYRSLSSIPCWFENRMIKKSIIEIDAIKHIIKKTKGQLLFLKEEISEDIYYVKRGTCTLTLL
nr:hypothetical protein [Bacteroidota bacterium]